MSLYDREGIENYDRRAFYERVQAEQEDIISALKTTVSCWTENEIDTGNKPMFERFRDEYPEWDHEELYATIAEEMGRVESIIESEKRGRLSGIS